jgi:hypothetical protein
MIAQSVGCSWLLALSAWDAGEPTSQEVFQAQTWPFEARLVAFLKKSGARGPPEKLIKMATGQRR